jgi:hypothetical protein
MAYLEVNSIGLALDIAGVLVLFKYGLPSKVREGGVQHLLLEGTDNEQALLFTRYQRFARCGLGLLVLGFALQIISNLMKGGFGLVAV